jgi:trans-aconitate 2-methyltransferase
MAWNPDQYLKFAQPRLRPALDLLGRISVADPKRIYDLGCGTGSITQLLAERWPSAVVCGVDDSAEMLAQAAQRPSRIEWLQQSVASWRPAEPASLIFSNAALHWLPNHGALFPSLINALEPGGVLAVQMPRNFFAPSHTLIYDTVREGPWRATLEHLITPTPVESPQFYYSLLHELAASLDIWETEYLHVLEGQNAVKEWTKGTWLKRFLDALNEPQRSEFEAEYARRLALVYPPLDNGKTLFPFRRLFIVLSRR